MAVCTHCKKPFSLTSHSLVTRVSAYTVLEFDCIECLIQYCNDVNTVYYKEAKDLLNRYMERKKAKKEIPLL